MGLCQRFCNGVKYTFNIGGSRDLQKALKYTDWDKRKEALRLAQDQWLKEIRENKQADIEKRLREYLEEKPDNLYGYKPLEIQGITYYMVGKFEKNRPDLG